MKKILAILVILVLGFAVFGLASKTATFTVKNQTVAFYLNGTLNPNYTDGQVGSGGEVVVDWNISADDFTLYFIISQSSSGTSNVKVNTTFSATPLEYASRDGAIFRTEEPIITSEYINPDSVDQNSVMDSLIDIFYWLIMRQQRKKESSSTLAKYKVTWPHNEELVPNENQDDYYTGAVYLTYETI